MAVWFMRWLQCLLCEESSLYHVEIANDAGRVETPTTDPRNNVLRARQHAHALNHGGAIV
jgi:hypothetical protein